MDKVEVSVARMEVQVERLEKDVAEMKGDIKSILATLDKASVAGRCLCLLVVCLPQSVAL